MKHKRIGPPPNIADEPSGPFVERSYAVHNMELRTWHNGACPRCSPVEYAKTSAKHKKGNDNAQVYPRRRV